MFWIFISNYLTWSNSQNLKYVSMMSAHEGDNGTFLILAVLLYRIWKYTWSFLMIMKSLCGTTLPAIHLIHLYQGHCWLGQ